MKKHTVKHAILLAAAAFSFSPLAAAQNLDKAISDFEAKDFEGAAAGFYAVNRLSDEPGEITEAQYGLARSF